MDGNGKDSKDDYHHYLLLICTLISIILFLVYLSGVLYYIIKNYKKKKLCVFWIDYISLIFGAIYFTFVYLIYLFGYSEEKRNPNPKKLPDDFYPPAVVMSLSLMCFTLIGTLFFDAIMAIRLSIKMRKMKLINELDLFSLSEKLNNIDYADILQMKSHHIYNIVFGVINIALIILEILTYIDLNPERYKKKLNLDSFFNFFIRYYHLVVLAFLIISIGIMNSNKKSLLDKYYYNKNRIALKVYDAHLSQIVYFTDVISFKLVADLIMNVPALLFMSYGKFDTFTLVLSEISFFLYIFFGGGEYFVIDKNSKAGKINKYIKTLFCLRKFDFHFGEKNVRQILDEFNFHYSPEEKKILNNLNINIIKNVEYNLSKDENENNFNSSIIELQVTNPHDKKVIEKKKLIEFNLVSEFYLVHKILMLYFEKNLSMYENALKAMEENGLTFKNMGKSQKSLLTSKSNLLNITINTVNQFSSKEGKKLITFLKLPQQEIFSSFEEKELFEELRNELELDDENIFQLESLFSSNLFELFPFYQMSIKTILKSLNPSNNLKLFEKFIKRNNEDKDNENYTKINQDNVLNIKNINHIRTKSEVIMKNNISNDKNKSNNNKNININLNGKIDIYLDENSTYSRKSISHLTSNINIDMNNDKKNLENNLYYTYNLFLMYEIYDISEFIDIQELKTIIKEYQSYILNTVKNMSYSFLPLIIGIYKLKIFDSEKIVILYRNPLYFSNLGHFNRWINFYLTEEEEKIKVSSMFNDIIDIKEIEMKNQIELYEADYDEVKIALAQDYLFMEKAGNIFPILHLFIGEENDLSKELMNKRMKKEGYINPFENSILFGYSKMGNDTMNNDKENVLDLLNNVNNNTTLPNLNGDEEENNNLFDEMNSLLDKEYYFAEGNNLRSIKIYFTNLFRKECELNKKEKNSNYKIDSNTYCKYLEEQLITLINKKTLFSQIKEYEKGKIEEKEEKGELIVLNDNNNIEEKKENE